MGHSHDHSHATSTTGTRLLVTMLLNFAITAVEIVGGLLAGSLSLISDALHNFSDGFAIIISYLAIKLKSKENSCRHTFGFKRAEIFAAVINSAALVAISIYLFYEAVVRFLHPQPVSGNLMMAVAAVGLAANVAGVLLLERDSHDSMNIKSTYLHLFSDALSSLGVILGGGAIYFWKIYWVDPVLTVLIGFYILKESYHILMQAVHVLMEGAPPDISLEAVRDAVEALPGVEDIHHIHIWTVGENDIHLEAHVNVADMLISASTDLHRTIEHILNEQFGIHHITLQFECDQCEEVGLIKNKLKKVDH